MRDVLGSATGYGLLTVTGSEHKQMRKAMNPAFSIPNLMARKFTWITTKYHLIVIFFFRERFVLGSY